MIDIKNRTKKNKTKAKDGPRVHSFLSRSLVPASCLVNPGVLGTHLGRQTPSEVECTDVFSAEHR